jgi:poly(A) polymerase
MRTDSRVEAARTISERLRAAGHEAYIAGGAVRDLLLGVPPRDVDVATSARPEQVTALFETTREVGASFGVVLVTSEGISVEVATFRREGPYLDGRRPSSVDYATARDDVLRRDFTVNGLLLDPATDEILDLVGGRADLEAKVLRCIGRPEARFAEDHLRLLRAVRLAAQLDFAIEANTERAIRLLADHAHEVAAERTREELSRMLTGPAPARAVELMDSTGLLAVVLPEVAAMRGIAQPPEYHPEGDVLTHTLDVLRELEHPGTELAFAALLHDVGKPPTFTQGDDRIRFPRHAKLGATLADEVCHRLRFSNDSRERIVDLVAHHMRFTDIQRMKVSTLKRFLRRPDFAEHLELHRADCQASHRDLKNFEYAKAKLEEFGREELCPPRLVSGEDLLELGYEQGPRLGRELKRLEELQLEGSLLTREEALAVAREDLHRERA